MKNVFQKILTGGALAAALFQGGAAHAEGRKIYPGAACVAVTGEAQPTASGYAQNPGTAAATILCPIAGDPRNTGDQASDIFLTDTHYSANICCSSRSKNGGGNALQFTADKCTSGVDSSVHLLFAGPVTVGSWSNRFFQCTVPGTYLGNKSSILTYRAEEL